MNDQVMKFIVVDVDGEAVLRFPVFPVADSENLNRTEAIIASNPILRLVDNVEIGAMWNGTEYI